MRTTGTNLTILLLLIVSASMVRAQSMIPPSPLGAPPTPRSHLLRNFSSRFHPVMDSIFDVRNAVPTGAQRLPSFFPPHKPSATYGENISLIDTATVFSGEDTTRQIFAFTPASKVFTTFWQQWSGGAWVNSSLSITTYDSTGREYSVMIEQWSNGQWTNLYFYTFAYDDNGNLLSELVQAGSGNAWANSYRNIYAYDAHGNQLSEIYQFWSNGQWVNRGCYKYTFNANNDPTSFLDQDWSNGRWVNDFIDSSTWDSHGHELSVIGKNWLNNAWVDIARDFYTYDSTGYETSGVYETWTAGAWVRVDSTTFTYDVNGNELGYVTQKWDGTQWVNSQLYAYTFGSGSRLLSVLYQDWGDSGWYNNTLTTNTFNEQGNETSSLQQNYWNYQWNDYSLTAYAFDANGVAIGYSNSTGSSLGWVPADGTFVVTDGGGNTHVFNGYNVSLGRTNIVTGIRPRAGEVPAAYSLHQNYPNPFNPTTTLRYDLPKESFVRLSIFNVLGQEVRTLVNQTEQAGSKSISFNGSNLPSGVYFYKLKAGNFEDVKKLVLVK